VANVNKKKRQQGEPAEAAAAALATAYHAPCPLSALLYHSYFHSLTLPCCIPLSTIAKALNERDDGIRVSSIHRLVRDDCVRVSSIHHSVGDDELGFQLGFHPVHGLGRLGAHRGGKLSCGGL